VVDIAGVREALHKSPFQPFVIRLADGRALSVPHPDFVALTPRRVIVGSENDSWSVVESFLIVSLDSIDGGSGNGPTRKKKRAAAEKRSPRADPRVMPKKCLRSRFVNRPLPSAMSVAIDTAARQAKWQLI
jgi:hypothetical protein